MRIYELMGKNGTIAFVVDLFGRDHLPIHVHVRSPKGTIGAIFEWRNNRFIVNQSTINKLKKSDITQIETYLNQRKDQILEKWREVNG